MSLLPRVQDPGMELTHSQPENTQFNANWVPVPTGDGGRGVHPTFSAGKRTITTSRHVN